ncbi:MAG: hypothetical protein IJP29_04100 [Lachnospiraceae bacterium]|nr:hypothetical protein [Lachnospiraceae bacterium]
MHAFHGAQKVHVFSEKRIIKSCAVGETNVEEIKWLSDMILKYATEWKEAGWGYLVGIGEMTPVKAEVSAELVNLHKAVEEVGCKAIAFVDPDNFVIAVQAKRHQKKSKAGYLEKHFPSEEAAIEWLEKMLQ